MRLILLIAAALALSQSAAFGATSPQGTSWRDIGNRPAKAEPSFIRVAEEAASEKPAEKKSKEAEPVLPMPPTTAVEQTPGEQYCSNVFDAAATARLAEQKKELAKAEKQIDERIAALAAKTDELKSWIKKREDFTSRATDALVQIYSKMKPDAAAGQLMAMDELMAAAVVSKLSPKANSLILSEMDATKAARLSAIMAGAGEVTLKAERKADAQ
jgi:flagellar motility protein MotE (MotC chaperone)